MNENANTWTLASAWNASFEPKERLYEPRERLWASELWKADIDLYHLLRGRQPSNKPNGRSMRKFDAGNLQEWFIKLVLARMGIYKASQTRAVFQEEGLLSVSGKIDFLAGGVPELNPQIEAILGGMELPEMFDAVSQKTIEFFREKFPNGLEEKGLEIKSVATFGFDRIERTKSPLPGHDMQAYHYARALNIKFSLVYVCREDLRMIEFVISPDDEILEKKYMDRIRDVSKFHYAGIEPQREPLILYDSAMGKFSKNLKVEYSPYLTDIYGFQEPSEYADRFKKNIASWNRVLGRISKGAKMTPKNEEALKQIKDFGFDVEFIKKNLAELAALGYQPAEEEAEE